MTTTSNLLKSAWVLLTVSTVTDQNHVTNTEQLLTKIAKVQIRALHDFGADGAPMGADTTLTENRQCQIQNVMGKHRGKTMDTGRAVENLQCPTVS